MGCFLGCFGGPKHHRQTKPIKRIPSRERNSLPKQQQQQRRSSPLKLRLLPGEGARPGSHLESRDVSEEWLNLLKQLPEEKPPTPVLELRCLPEEKAPTPVLELRGEKQGSINPRKRVTFDLNVKTYDAVPVNDDQIYSAGDVREEQKSQKGGISTPPIGEAFPSNHRYQSCTIIDSENSEEDDDDDDDDYEDGVFDDEEDIIRGSNEEEESFMSYFSQPMEKEKQNYKDAIASSLAARDRSRYVRSVLNPVENLSQWKEAKIKAQPSNLKLLKKENIDVGRGPERAFSSLPGFELPTKSQRTPDSAPDLNIRTKDEVFVDASLASWMPSSGTTPVKVSKGSIFCRTESKAGLHQQAVAGAAVSN